MASVTADQKRQETNEKGTAIGWEEAGGVQANIR